MQNLMIKSHKPNSMYLGEYIFILNKGLNSGKPMHEPCPNCFVMIFTSKEDKESYYWLSYSLWKAKFWHQHLVGSVIPFLRIFDFKKEFDCRCRNMMQDFEVHTKNVKALQLLEQKEAQFHKNLALINDMKRVILYRYINNK
jgi:hypothetical protein